MAPIVAPRDDVETACARLREVLAETRSLDRRRFIAALGRAAAGSALLSSLPGLAPRAQAAAPVTVFVYGGSWKQAAITAYGDPFTTRTGLPVQYQEPYSFAKLRAMHDAKSQQIDAASGGGDEAISAGRLKMLAPLDWQIIDRSALSPRQLRYPNAIIGHALSMVLCYRKKTWPGDDHPRSWADFWDVTRFPGRRALRRDASWTLDVALLADGATENGFYPLDVDRGFRSLDRIKPNVKTWWSDNAQSQQLMEQEEVDLIAMMNGRASDSITNHGAPYEIVWNGASYDTNAWFAPAGSPNPEGAMKFLGFVGRPEPLAVFARLLFYGPFNPKAYEFLDPEIARLLPTYPEYEKVSHAVNREWWADNQAQVQRRFERWLQS